jgi:hypothetical protein
MSSSLRGDSWRLGGSFAPCAGRLQALRKHARRGRRRRSWAADVVTHDRERELITVIPMHALNRFQVGLGPRERQRPQLEQVAATTDSTRGHTDGWGWLQLNHLWVKYRQEENMREQAVTETGLVWTALEEAENYRCALPLSMHPHVHYTPLPHHRPAAQERRSSACCATGKAFVCSAQGVAP